jgi:hypothetical protein
MSGGGGYGSKQHREVGYKTGSGSHSKNPAKVAQLGQRIGDHVMGSVTGGDGGSTGYRGEPRSLTPSFQPTQFGNELAVNTKCGPGGSRTIYGKSGTQGMQGRPDPGNAPSKSTDILSQFGPDYRGRGSR